MSANRKFFDTQFITFNFSAEEWRGFPLYASEEELPAVYSPRLRGVEQDTGFEPALSAWKADVLAADTNPAYGSFPVFWRYYLTQVDFVVCSQITRSNKTNQNAEMNEIVFFFLNQRIVIKLSLSHAVFVTPDYQKRYSV